MHKIMSIRLVHVISNVEPYILHCRGDRTRSALTSKLTCKRVEHNAVVIRRHKSGARSAPSADRGAGQRCLKAGWLLSIAHTLIHSLSGGQCRAFTKARMSRRAYWEGYGAAAERGAVEAWMGVC